MTSLIHRTRIRATVLYALFNLHFFEEKRSADVTSLYLTFSKLFRYLSMKMINFRDTVNKNLSTNDVLHLSYSRIPYDRCIPYVPARKSGRGRRSEVSDYCQRSTDVRHLAGVFHDFMPEVVGMKAHQRSRYRRKAALCSRVISLRVRRVHRRSRALTVQHWSASAWNCL